MSEFLTADELAKVLKCSPETVRKLHRRGKLQAQRVPGTRRLLFATNDVEAALEKAPPSSASTYAQAVAAE